MNIDDYGFLFIVFGTLSQSLRSKIILSDVWSDTIMDLVN